MLLRNLLFTLSLLMFLGCTQTSEDHSNCKATADSLDRVHSQVLDSLNLIILNQKETITGLEGEYNHLVDYLNSMGKEKTEKNIPKTMQLGLETKVPVKRP